MDYTIENEYLKVTVTTFGAQLKSVVRKCDGVEHMWQADPDVWGYHAPILFPFTGRVKDDVIEVEGKTYPAKKHGFARLMEYTLIQQEPDKLVFGITQSPETLAQFPFAFRLRSTFRLEGDCVAHTLLVGNQDEKPMPFGIGFHPAFAIPFDDNHTFRDYELRFDKMESPMCINCMPNGLVTGDLYYLGSNIQSIPVDEHLFDNDSHCMVNLSSGTLGLYEKDTGRGVVCSIEDFPYTLIWSKPGEPRFICIEPWFSIPSAENGSRKWEEKPAAAVLAPGKHWHRTLRMRFVR